ncbi:transglycosylase domain-containing protein [Anaerosinus massiliensis]|uniref:transglycosylase domain-containing protein n=1 Tax=Massilibacillus massiliensis TaxID=1806837 RepID=UPI000B276A0D|nr:PBP1A family penicillin-binding protein [Massilibacillus massiliensis]
MYKLIILISSIFVFSLASYVYIGLPDTTNINDLKLISATQVYDINGNLISKLFEQNRIVVTNNNMSPYLSQAIIANEDTRFYQHIGIDPIGIARALWVNIKAGDITEGGSTITQQLAREMFLNQERTLVRKMREAILAIIIDFKFSKDEILQAYLNQVYLGEGAYGVEAAAQKYFGKHANELDLSESAMIAGLARGPVLYSPYRDMSAALERRSIVLSNMREQEYISADEKDRAESQAISLVSKKERSVKASYFVDYIAKQLVEKYGEETVYQRGLKVYTTLDLHIQEAMENVLGEYQGAVVALDPKTGYIKAMVGGNNYAESQLNRAVDEYRQPGSAFKPFVYTTALNQGITSNYIVVDEPIDIAGYRPQNYDHKYLGKMTINKALRWSVNSVAVKMGQKVGMREVLNLAKSMGITTLTEDDNNLATALGGLTVGVNLLELSAAYTTFANHGVLSQPISILRVENEHNQTLAEYQSNQKAVLNEDIAYIMTNMLMGALKDGTATAANIGREAAGKTGTTDSYETAWFIGYTPDLLVGIYVGNDDRSSIGISGSQVAALWGKSMFDLQKNQPVTKFDVPANIVKDVRICAKTGELAEKDCKDDEYSAFIKGTEPKSILQKIKEKILPKQEKEENKKSKSWWSILPRLPGF